MATSPHGATLIINPLHSRHISHIYQPNLEHQHLDQRFLDEYQSEDDGSDRDDSYEHEDERNHSHNHNHNLHQDRLEEEDQVPLSEARSTDLSGDVGPGGSGRQPTGGVGDIISTNDNMNIAMQEQQMAHGTTTMQAHYDSRSGTPSRYVGAFSSDGGPMQVQTSPKPVTTKDQTNTPSSTGLIRLTLRKPMGIVFEPMYDPNNSSVQRGVRICDLPRTGAAALSRKLEVGDELLSINDKTMSRLSFDEIMDFIIEADPEEVNLLFRRPRKETLSARHSAKAQSTKAKSNSTSGVKWVDDEHRNKKRGDKKKAATSSTDRKSDRKVSRKSRKDDEETAVSEDNDYRSRGKRKTRSKKDPYESESFLDILIDTICANPDSVCRDRRRNNDDDYYSDEDDGTFASRDDSTYVTYESEEPSNAIKNGKVKGKGQNRDDDSSTYDDDQDDDDVQDDPKVKSGKREKDGSRLSPPKEAKRNSSPEPVKKTSGRYEDDRTLETMEYSERPETEPEPEPVPVPAPVVPLGLAPENLLPNPMPEDQVVPSDTDDDRNPAPIKEVQYDDQVDHGADVSVMESLGGPSLLIDQQRQAAIKAAKETTPVPSVPEEYIEKFGQDYPVDFGFTLHQTVDNDPLRFYTFVVKSLLKEHEPEKVRLLDKLLAKYKGREDHLVQKLSVRYNKDEEPDAMPEETHHNEPAEAFEDAVKKGKDSATASAAIQTAKQRMDSSDRAFEVSGWPDKETKEPDAEDHQSIPDEDDSEFGSDYSGDSIDGTSPAVIAQVSELLNYVYGKTSVPGQIDRVSVIMRAYEGREAVLLELLETKALIKANREKENAGNLPSFIRNSAVSQRNLDDDVHGAGDVPPVTPMATQPQAISGSSGGGGALNDDISSMSGVSSPANEGQHQTPNMPNMLKPVASYPEESPSYDFHPEVEQVISAKAFEDQDLEQQLDQNSFEEEFHTEPSTPNSGKSRPLPTPDRSEKKKKKGIFGGLFGGKKGRKSKEMPVIPNERTASRSRGLRSPMSRKLKNKSSTEGSI